jgi:hypothetical protein
MSEYYKTHHYKKKTRWEKVKYHFGKVDADEKAFLDVKRASREEYHQSKKQFKTSWGIGPDNGMQLRLRGQRKKDHMGPKRYTDIKIAGATTRLQAKLRLVAHWLMGDTDHNKQDAIQGLPRDYTGYKLKRELEKFKVKFAGDLNNNENRELDASIKCLETHCDLLDRISFSQTLSNTFRNPLAQQRLNDINYRACKAIHELQPGERFLLPHGFRVDGGAGHATLVEYIKNADHTVDVRFINTGSGNSSHLAAKTPDVFALISDIASFINALQGKTSVYTSKGYDLNQLFIDDLIKQLLDPIVLPSDNSDDGEKRMVAPLFQLQQDGKLVADKNIKLQTNGTCSHSCIMAWLQVTLPEDIYQGFELFGIKRADARLDKLVGSEDVYTVVPNIAEIQTSLKASSTASQATITDWMKAREKKAQAHVDSTYTKILKASKNQRPVIDDKYIAKRRQKLIDVQVEQATLGVPSDRTQVDRVKDKAKSILSGVAKLFKPKKVATKADERIKSDEALDETTAKRKKLQKKIDLAQQHIDARHTVALMKRFTA